METSSGGKPSGRAEPPFSTLPLFLPLPRDGSSGGGDGGDDGRVEVGGGSSWECWARCKSQLRGQLSAFPVLVAMLEAKDKLG
ncbi:hypothetical protein Q5P01_022083 [Channa striata]|uniref:Uncharacterized protein n=1 Tax=Channa striata TaxID=64152 RepID=A0AA88IX70_CHASR|nr:hypothetical protein Q5P01_022083 [Channa striata]